MPKTKQITVKQQRFIDEYMKTGNGMQSYINAGYKNGKYARQNARRILENDYIQAEINRRNEERTKAALVDSAEVLQFFADVMRGNVKDQFGLETSVADRIKAGQELAKRTIDIENRIAGKADAKVEISLDWGESDGGIEAQQ